MQRSLVLLQSRVPVGARLGLEDGFRWPSPETGRVDVLVDESTCRLARKSVRRIPIMTYRQDVRQLSSHPRQLEITGDPTDQDLRRSSQQAGP